MFKARMMNWKFRITERSVVEISMIRDANPLAHRATQTTCLTLRHAGHCVAFLSIVLALMYQTHVRPMRHTAHYVHRVIPVIALHRPLRRFSLGPFVIGGRPLRHTNHRAGFLLAHMKCK